MTYPSNVAVTTNNAATFTCVTDSTSSATVLIVWYYIGPGTTALLSAFAPACNVNDAYKSIYQTENPAAGVCNLIINSTQLENTGSYVCQDQQTTKFSTAELVVLGKYGTEFSLC